jgi:hypothetical protein
MSQKKQTLKCSITLENMYGHNLFVNKIQTRVIVMFVDMKKNRHYCLLQIKIPSANLLFILFFQRFIKG